MSNTLVVPTGYEQIAELTLAHRDDLHRLYGQTWWARDRKLQDVDRVLRNSKPIVGICECGSRKLVAFARVLTDFIYKATIYDVIVDEKLRGRGFGRVLIETVLNHPDLQNVPDIELYTRAELIPFYAKWGFTGDLPEVRFLRKRT
ncbi:MAG TPA: GNAT family N-acetyltransferase [Candidatus Acidoferrum sp.]|nr:GNAT family N-acetyltransferase [Candidatus Acidoferrum sp.]